MNGEDDTFPEGEQVADELGEARARIDALEMEVMEKNLELNHYLVRATELTQEVEKVKDRTAREATKHIERKRRDMLLGFLEVMDDFDRALDSKAFVSGRRDPEAAAVIEGVKLVRQRLLAKLGEHGVARVEAVGLEFDPNLHEAVGVVAASGPGQVGRVMGVARPGYSIGDDLLRPASVTVAK